LSCFSDGAEIERPAHVFLLPKAKHCDGLARVRLVGNAARDPFLDGQLDTRDNYRDIAPGDRLVHREIGNPDRDFIVPRVARDFVGGDDEPQPAVSVENTEKRRRPRITLDAIEVAAAFASRAPACAAMRDLVAFYAWRSCTTTRLAPFTAKSLLSPGMTISVRGPPAELSLTSSGRLSAAFPLGAPLLVIVKICSMVTLPRLAPRCARP
jgi:hypothetical protein